jgi:hypothetical protein
MKIEAIRDVLQIARDMHGSNDKMLPKVIKLSHAKVACALSRKLSIQDSSVENASLCQVTSHAGYST